MNGIMLKPFIASLLTTACVYAGDLQQDLNTGSYSKVIKNHQAIDSNQAKFTVAIAQLAQSLETLQRGFYKYGLSVNSSTMGIRNMNPLPNNPRPVEIDYTKFRKLITDFNTSLSAIEKTLSSLNEEEFNLPLDLTKIRFDINQDGKYDESESGLSLFVTVNRNGQPIPREQLDEIAEFDGTIHFDRSDLLWLKGYTQVLLGTTNLVLAHDFQQAFDTISYRLFPKTDTSAKYAAFNEARYDDIADLIAMFHNTHMPVTDPARLKQARLNLLEMVTCSKSMWESVLAENDDQFEWLPSPKQESVTGIKITQKMVDDWHKFLDEYEAILEGKKLIPHWRFKGKGINLKKAFEENSETDLILWVTGHAAIPYLEEGELTDDNLWNQLNRTFNGNFLGMSFFIN